MALDNLIKGYFAIENEFKKRRDQAASVAGKETPFRVEFRYPGGTKHYQYFCTYEDALKADDSLCGYFLGNPYIKRPLSQQIQVKGPRGGWSKYRTRGGR